MNNPGTSGVNPYISPDGLWVWDGQQWVPNPSAAPAPQPAAERSRRPPHWLLTWAVRLLITEIVLNIVGGFVVGVIPLVGYLLEILSIVAFVIALIYVWKARNRTR